VAQARLLRLAVEFCMELLARPCLPKRLELLGLRPLRFVLLRALL
jgi:hypothetical protein